MHHTGAKRTFHIDKGCICVDLAYATNEKMTGKESTYHRTLEHMKKKLERNAFLAIFCVVNFTVGPT